MTVEATQKKSSFLPFILGFFGFLFICVCCCCIALFGVSAAGIGVFFGAVDRIDKEILDEICNADKNDLRNVYEDFMNERYQRQNSFNEFENLYESNRDFFGECDNVLEEIDWSDFFNDFSIRYSTQDGELFVEIEFEYDNETVFLRAVEENEELKLDDIEFRD